MQDNFQTEKCSENDVLEFGSGAYRVRNIIQKVIESKAMLAKQLYELLKNQKIDIYPGYHQATKSIDYRKWFDDGIDCEMLQIGAKDWQKGKVRLKVTFEFIPDEPGENSLESPLDEIRQTANNSN